MPFTHLIQVLLGKRAPGAETANAEDDETELIPSDKLSNSDEQNLAADPTMAKRAPKKNYRAQWRTNGHHSSVMLG